MLLLADQLVVVGRVGAVDRVGTGHVLPVALQHHGQVALHRALGGLGDPVDELGDRRPLLDHLHGRVVGRPVAVADQRGVFVAQGEQLVQQRLVLRVAALEERDRHRTAYVGVADEHARRHGVGVVGRDRDQSLLVCRVRAQPVLRHARQLLGRRADGADVVADVAAELLVGRGDPLADLGQPGTCRVVLVDARAPELLERLVQQPRRRRVEHGRVEGHEHVVERTVLAQLGDELVDLDRGLLTRGPDLELRVHVGQQRREPTDVAERQRHLVPPAQHVERLDRRARSAALRRAHARAASPPAVRSRTQPRASSDVGSSSGAGGVMQKP